MLTVRPGKEIYEKQGGWFHARWHFSFDQYWDPAWMGIGALRVFNDDRIIGGAAWPMHPHRDIESLTYVVEGDFEHADSLGNDGRLRAGGAQVMSFGHSGAEHSERNGSPHETLRFLQFWILPSDPRLSNGVQQRQYERADRGNQWLQIMGPSGEEGLDLAQDARVLVSRLSAGRSLDFVLSTDRGGYLYLIEGAARFDDYDIAVGDAGVLTGPHELALEATDDSELILVDVPLQFR